MGDNQAKVAPEAVTDSIPSQNASEPPKVEITVGPEQKSPESSPQTDASTVAEQNGSVAPAVAEDLSQLTTAILEALSFDSANKTEQELQAHNGKLQGLLGRVLELLKEKTSLCSNLEKQNKALMIQTNSLKDVVAITKELLNIRNMEVKHLNVDIKSMEEKINGERERHNNMINRMSEAVKLNENLKSEYQSQMKLFTDLRTSYEKKVALLEGENKRLLAQVSGSPTVGGEGEGIQLTLDTISPP